MNACFWSSFSFTFLKIEQKYLLSLIHLISAGLWGNSQRLYFTKTTLQKMRKTAMERYDTKHEPNACLKLRYYAREFFSTKTFHRSILSWVPVLPRQVPQNRDKLNFLRDSQHRIDFTRLHHRWPLFFKTRITCSSYNLQNMMKWKNSQYKKLSFFKFFFPCVLSSGSSYNG